VRLRLRDNQTRNVAIHPKATRLILHRHPGTRHNSATSSVPTSARRLAAPNSKDPPAEYAIAGKPNQKRGRAMPAAGTPAIKSDYPAVIYLRNTGNTSLDDAEHRCREYAHRFGWPIVESIRDSGANISPDHLLTIASQLGAQVILTYTLDMIAPDQDARDDLMMTMERAEYILHPVNNPSRS
jgi:hypothetical protein